MYIVGKMAEVENADCGEVVCEEGVQGMLTNLIKVVNDNINSMKVVARELRNVQVRVNRETRKTGGRRGQTKRNVGVKSTSFQQKYLVSKTMMNFVNNEPELLEKVLGSPSPITRENGIARGEFSKFLSLYNKKYNLVGKKEDGTVTGAIIIDINDKTGPISTEPGKRLYNLFIFPEVDGKPEIPDRIVWKNIQKFISKHYLGPVAQQPAPPAPVAPCDSAESVPDTPSDSSTGESIKERMKKRNTVRTPTTSKIVSN